MDAPNEAQDKGPPAKRLRLDSEAMNNTTDGFQVKKRIGTDNKGFDYEKYMLLWVLLMLLEDEDVQEFYITDNIDGIGAFDDVIVRVKRKSPEDGSIVRELICVQLKHKETTEKTITWQDVAGNRKGQYQLQKYFDGYKKMQALMHKFNDPILDECLQEDVTLVMYTNANFEFEEDTLDKNSFCRRLLETESASTVFNFNGEELNAKLWGKIQEYHKSFYNKKTEIAEFIKKVIFFSNQNNTTLLKEKIKNKLKTYGNCETISPEDALQRAVRFISENTSMWLSRHSGVLKNILFSYQGIPVKLCDMEKLWGNSAARKIIVKQICHDNESGLLTVGKTLKKSEHYYVERKTLNSKMMSDDEKNQSLNLWHLLYNTPRYEKEVLAWREKMIRSSMVLLCAGPGMGKSSYFTRKAEEIKKANPEKFIIRENLVDYSAYLSKIDLEEDIKTVTKNFLMEIAGVLTNSIEDDAFQCSLHGDNIMVIFLDGVDEISPHYYKKLLYIIQTIRRDYKTQLWVSTRPVVQLRMEEDLQVSSWTMEEFSWKDRTMFIEKYCGVKDYNIGATARELLGIPIFCRMLGDVINNELKNNSKPLEAISNKIELYDKFIDVMYQVYHQDKEKIDMTRAAAISKMKKLKRIAMDEHEKAAMLEVFDQSELTELKWNIEYQVEDFLKELTDGEEKAGLIIDIVRGRPKFVHRTIAEYFCGRWFAKNSAKFEEYKNKYQHLPKEVEYFMTYKLVNIDAFFRTILLERDEDIIEDYLKKNINKFNMVDPWGRTALYYADLSDNEPALRYILYNGFKVTEQIVRSNVFINEESKDTFNLFLAVYWFNSVIMKYKQHGHLLGLLVHVLLDTPYFLLHHSKGFPLHVAILNENRQKIIHIVEDFVNVKNALGLTPMHLAVWMRDVETVHLLVQHGAEYSKDNVLGLYPHHFIGLYYYEEVHKLLKELFGEYMKDEAWKKDILDEDYVSQNLMLHDAVQKNDLKRVESIESLISYKNSSGGVNSIDSKGRGFLHVAAARSYVDSRINDYLLTLDGVIYTRDANGFYPHEYAENRDVAQVLCGFGFACGLENLPENEKKIFGKKLERILKEYGRCRMFVKGMKAKKYKESPFQDSSNSDNSEVD